MNAVSKLRVMWLLNHTTARKFEIPMLKNLGISQIFTPKKFPNDPSFRSASVDFSQDQFLNIPEKHLEILNDTDWYRGGDRESWSLANKYFDLAFFIPHHREVISIAAREFEGAIAWRAYGITSNTKSFANMIMNYDSLKDSIAKLGNRFYFAEAYNNLTLNEPDYIKKNCIYLPLGIPNIPNNIAWKAEKKRIYFVCPDIGYNDYYNQVYKSFISDFKDFDYIISGAQPIRIYDSRVVGYVSEAEHALNMRSSSAMFYHSTEARHIHYHPFEAIRIGMPLIFMGGGMLDHFGGVGLPGRCRNIDEARNKLKRIIQGDKKFITKCVESQFVLLEPMKTENCVDDWIKGISKISKDLQFSKTEILSRPKAAKKSTRIAVILPAEYRGGSLRGAQVLAKALYLGSRHYNENADILFCHLDNKEVYREDLFESLTNSIVLRPFIWKTISAEEARRAMKYAGFIEWEPISNYYLIPDDGINNLLDCDLWLIVSDRLNCPILPIRPIVMMVYDYIQRYEPIIDINQNINFIGAARAADRVLVTTNFTKQDAMDYCGIEADKISKVPMLAPELQIENEYSVDLENERNYFIWTTNAGLHKNHALSFEALSIYYNEYDGKLQCYITGVNSKNLIKNVSSGLEPSYNKTSKGMNFNKHIKFKGELTDYMYRGLLKGSAFIWHPAKIDNGTFSVIEAACYGIPALSSDYPAMREINSQFSLDLLWMDANSARDMAKQLKKIELLSPRLRDSMRNNSISTLTSITTHAPAYWEEIRKCL